MNYSNETSSSAGDRDLAHTVGEFIDTHGLIRPEERVLVAVSGGCDSAVMLDVLVTLSEQKNFKLAVAHLDHCIREESPDDEQFVRLLARKYSIEFFSGRADVPRQARATGEGIEQTARAMRYEFLEHQARQWRAGKVALGHHRDDNIETVLYRIARGTHLRGLAGMPVRRRLGGDVEIIRPMLGVSRAEIETFARCSHIDWVTDRTNADTEYRRNFIRHELLPMLRERLNPRVDEAIARLAAGACETHEALVSLARATLESAQDQPAGVFDRSEMLRQPRVVRACIIRQTLEQMGMAMRDVSSRVLHSACDVLYDDGPSAVMLPRGWEIRRTGPQVVIVPRRSQPVTPKDEFAVLPLRVPSISKLTDGSELAVSRVDATTMDVATLRASHRPGVEMIDAGAVRGDLIARRRKDGDVFRPINSPGRRSVSDFLTDLKIPHEQRASAWCVCDDEGIVYLAPLRIAHRVRVTDSTKNALKMEFRPAGPEA